MGLVRNMDNGEMENRIPDLPDAVPEEAQAAAEAVCDAAGETAGLAHEAVGQAAEVAGQAEDAAAEAVCDAAEEAASLADEVFDQAAEAAVQAEEAAEETVSKAAEETEEMADEAVEQAAEVAEQVEETAKEAVCDAAEEATELADEAVEQATEAVEQMEEAAAEAVCDAAEEAEELAEDAAEQADEAADKAEEAAAQVERGFEELFGQLNAASGGNGDASGAKSASVFAGAYAPEDIPVNVSEPEDAIPEEPAPDKREESASPEETALPEGPAPAVMDVINPKKEEEDPFAQLDTAPGTEGETGDVLDEKSEEEEEEEKDHISPVTGRDSRGELKSEKWFDRGFGIVFWILFGLGVLAVAYPFVAAKVEKIPFYPELYKKVCLFLPAVMGFAASFTAHLGPFKGFMVLLFTGVYSLFCSAIGQEDPRNINAYLPEIAGNAGRFYYITVVAILIGAVAGYVFTLFFNRAKHKTLEVTKEDRKSAFCAFALMLLSGFALYYLLGGPCSWEVFAYAFAGLILLLCLAHAIRSGFSVGAMIGCDLLLAIALVGGWLDRFREVSVVGQNTFRESFEYFLFDRGALYIFLGGALVYLFVEFIGGIIYDGAEALVGMLWLLSVTLVGLPFIWSRIPFLGQFPPLAGLIACAVILGVTLLTACLVRGFSVGKAIVGVFLALLYLFADWVRHVLDGARGDIYYFTDWESIVYIAVAAGVILVACLIGGLVYRAKKKRGEQALEEEQKEAGEEAQEGPAEEVLEES